MNVVCVAWDTTTCTLVAVEAKRAPRTNAKPGSLLHGGNYNQGRTDDHNNWAGDDHDDNVDKDSPSGSVSQQKEDEVQYVRHDSNGPANNPPSPTVEDLIKMMFVQLFFS